MIGLDYTARIAPADLIAAKAAVICRYIAPQAWKVASPAECAEIRGHGLILFLNWESSADDCLGGASAGTAHGTQAAQLAAVRGYTTGWPVIGSCDFDISASQVPVATAYYRAFRDALAKGGYRAGIYGPKRALDIGVSLGFVFFWQSMSSAFYLNATQHPSTNLWQKGYKTVGGQVCDYSTIIKIPAFAERPSVSAVQQQENVAMNLNQQNMLAGLFNLSDTVVQYGTLAVLPGWNISTWVSDLNNQGHAVTWASLTAYNPGIFDNVDFQSNTFRAAYTYIDPSKPSTVPVPLTVAIKALTVGGVDANAVAAAIVAKLPAYPHTVTLSGTVE